MSIRIRKISRAASGAHRDSIINSATMGLLLHGKICTTMGLSHHVKKKAEAFICAIKKNEDSVYQHKIIRSWFCVNNLEMHNQIKKCSGCSIIKMMPRSGDAARMCCMRLLFNEK